jgi:probable HAF family extracellular repeat protein
MRQIIAPIVLLFAAKVFASPEFHTSASDINNAGQIVGQMQTPDGKHHAFLYTPNEGITDLGIDFAGNSSAKAINNFGHVTGYFYTKRMEIKAFFYSKETGMVDIGTLGGAYAYSNDINDHDQIVGESDIADGTSRAFLYSKDTGMIDIGSLPGSVASWANAINNSGHIVASSQDINDVVRGFLYTPEAEVIDFLSDKIGVTVANDINDLGQIVGSFEVPGGYNAYIYSASEGLKDLGALGLGATATAINARGDVIGDYAFDRNTWHSFFYTPATGMIKVDPLESNDANRINFHAINSTGVAVGTSQTSLLDENKERITHAFSYDVINGIVDLQTIIYP